MKQSALLIVKKGVELPPNIPDIFEAAKNNNLADLEIALQHYDVNVVNDKRMSALHYAAGNLSVEAVERLLKEKDIDPTIVDIYGRTASSMPLDVWGDLQDAISLSDFLRSYCYPDEWQEFNPDEPTNGF